MVQPLRSIVETILSRDLSPRARQMMAADFARARLAEGVEQNRQATGRLVPYTQTVDGRRGAALESVNPDNGRIIFMFDVAENQIFAFIAEQLVKHAPRLTGRFADSFNLFAGGREIAAGAALTKADAYTFLSPLPYAGRLERGSSDQAPDGVFQAVAALARQRYGDVASIRFTYRSLAEFGLAPATGGGRAAPKAERRQLRTPAIIVRLG